MHDDLKCLSEVVQNLLKNNRIKVLCWAALRPDINGIEIL